MLSTTTARFLAVVYVLYHSCPGHCHPTDIVSGRSLELSTCRKPLLPPMQILPRTLEKGTTGLESNERAVKMNDLSPDQDDSPAKQIKRAVDHHHVTQPEEPPLEDVARTDSSSYEFSSAEEYQTPMRQPVSRYRSHRRSSRRSPRMDMYNELPRRNWLFSWKVCGSF